MTGANHISYAEDSINADIHNLVGQSSSGAVISFMAHVMALEPVVQSADIESEMERVFPQELGPDLGSDPDAVPDNVEPNKASTKAVAAKYLELARSDEELQKGDIDIPKLLDVLKKICYAYFEHLFTRVFEDNPSQGITEDKKENMEARLDDVIEDLQDRIPFKHPDGKYVRRLGDHLSRAKEQVMERQMEPAWNPLRPAIFHIFMPWLVFKFAASFVSGPWNADNDFHVAFHDSQLAELSMYRMFFDITYRIRDNMDAVGVLTDEDDKTLFQQMGYCITTAIQKKFINPAETQAPEMHQYIADMSKTTKDTSEEMHKMGVVFETRRNNLENMLHNQRVTEERVKSQRRVFWVFVGVYVAIVLGFLLLLFFGKYNAVYYSAAIIVAAMVLWYVITRAVKVFSKDPYAI